MQRPICGGPKGNREPDSTCVLHSPRRCGCVWLHVWPQASPLAGPVSHRWVSAQLVQPFTERSTMTTAKAESGVAVVLLLKKLILVVVEGCLGMLAACASRPASGSRVAFVAPPCCLKAKHRKRELEGRPRDCRSAPVVVTSRPSTLRTRKHMVPFQDDVAHQGPYK